MKFAARQQDLNEGLKTVSRAVASKTSLPVLSGILVEADGSSDLLKLIGTDLEIGIESFVPAQVETNGRTVLPADYLNSIISKLPGGMVSFQIDEGHTCQINWNKSEFTIHGSDPEQFPELPEFNGEATVVFEEEQLHRLISQTIFAVSNDESRPMLTGIQFNFNGEDVQTIATDGFRIALQEGTVTSNSAPSKISSAVIPGRGLKELRRILNRNEGEVQVTLAEDQVAVEMQDTSFISQLLEGEYPQVLELVPKEYPTRLTMDREQFHTACERAALIATGSNNTNAIKLEAKSDHLVITANSPDVGRAYEEVPAHIEGQPIEVAFNPRYIIQGLERITTEQVKFSISGNLSPSRVDPVDGDGFFYVVLPMRNA